MSKVGFKSPQVASRVAEEPLTLCPAFFYSEERTLFQELYYLLEFV